MSNQQYLSTDVDPDNASRAELVAERRALRDLRTLMIAFLTGPTAPREQTLQTAFDLIDGRLMDALEIERHIEWDRAEQARLDDYYGSGRC